MPNKKSPDSHQDFAPLNLTTDQHKPTSPHLTRARRHLSMIKAGVSPAHLSQAPVTVLCFPDLSSECHKNRYKQA